MTRHDEAVALARHIFHLRRQRERHLPASVLSEAAWNILLALFIAHADGQAITALATLESADVQTAVGVRWLRVLHQEGLTIDGGLDDLGAVIGLSPAGIAAIEACMTDAQEHLRPLGDR